MIGPLRRSILAASGVLKGRGATLVCCVCCCLWAGFASAERLTVATLSDGNSAYAISAAFVSSVNTSQNGHQLYIDATFSEREQLVQLGRGNVDFAVASPTLVSEALDSAGYFASLDDASIIANNLRLLFWFPKGKMHAIAKADNNIRRFADIQGRVVYLGPEDSENRQSAEDWIQAITGYEPGRDYAVFEGPWSKGFAAFRSDRAELYVTNALEPDPRIRKIALRDRLRLLGLNEDEAGAVDTVSSDLSRIIKGPGKSILPIAADAYGNGMVNTADIFTLSETLAFVVRKDLADDVVYDIAKSFWTALPQTRQNNAFLDELTPQGALQLPFLALHPGAQRFYQEAGWQIPDALQ